MRRSKGQPSQEYLERKRLEKEESIAQTKAYNATRKKGYVPTKETLLPQIEALYAEGDLVTRWCTGDALSHTVYREYTHEQKLEQEQEWGLKGLALVHGYVEMAQSLPEQDEIPF